MGGGWSGHISQSVHGFNWPRGGLGGVREVGLLSQCIAGTIWTHGVGVVGSVTTNVLGGGEGASLLSF